MSTLNQKADPIGVLFRDHPFNFHEHETKVRLSFFLGQENVTKSCWKFHSNYLFLHLSGQDIFFYTICQMVVTLDVSIKITPPPAKKKSSKMAEVIFDQWKHRSLYWVDGCILSSLWILAVSFNIYIIYMGKFQNDSLYFI